MEKVASTLFGKTRQAVLTLLLESPEQAFHIRELARLTGISPGTVKYELDALADADLVTKAKDGNRVNYRANQASPVFEELRSIILKTSGIPLLIRGALKAFADKVRLAFIYGSIAKGTSQSRSDVDLLVVGELEFSDLVAALAPVERQLQREISVRLMGSREFADKLRRHDRFLTGIVRGPKLMVQGSMDELAESAR